MSAKQFIQHLQQNPQVQASLSADSWSIPAVVSAGAAAGFDFTADEYKSAYRELALDELSAITGGFAAMAGCSANWKKSLNLLDIVSNPDPTQVVAVAAITQVI